MGKSLEMRRKKNLDAFDEINEINWKSQDDDRMTQEELDSIRALLEEESEASFPEDKRESDAIEAGVLESEMDEEPQYLWDGLDIGKETINTPTQDKQQARQQETALEHARDTKSITK